VTVAGAGVGAGGAAVVATGTATLAVTVTGGAVLFNNSSNFFWSITWSVITVSF
jgi:hypothetical protein